MVFYWALITFLLPWKSCFGQGDLNSELCLLFGNLAMNLTTKENIANAEKNKNLKGNSLYNLDLSYSGFLVNPSYFRIKPGICFIEIVSNAQELGTDSSVSFDISVFSLDASYSNVDSNSVKGEFVRK